MTTPEELKYRKVLNKAACQGCVTLDKDVSVKDVEAITVLNLEDGGYLEIAKICASEIRYTITDKGRQYLKLLLNGKQIDTVEEDREVKKSDTTLEFLPKNQELEVVIAKRLNILKNANKRGLDFNLTDANIKALLNKKTCYYTGVVFDEDGDPMNARTFERIDNQKGYVNGNVVAVTLRANRIKNILLEQDNELKISLPQFLMMAEKIKNFR